MECQRVGCKESGQIECLVHKMRYCLRHYDIHKREGGEEEKKIILKVIEIERKCSEYQKQIIELSGNMIKFIQRITENAVRKVNQFREVLGEAVLRDEDLNDASKKVLTFIMKDNKMFRVNAQELMNVAELSAVEALIKGIKQKKEERKEVNETREKSETFLVNDLELKKRIAWIKGGNFDLSLIDRIDDIKVTKNQEFVLVCTFYLVSKKNTGKCYIDSMLY